MKEARKRFAVIITLESLKKLSGAITDAENVPLLTKGSWYTGRSYYLLSGVLAQKPIINFFFMKREFVCEQVLDFLHSSTSCSENSPFHIRKISPHERITLNVDQLLHHIQTEKTYYKNVFLRPDHASSKH